MRTGRRLGIDWGQARIGVAASDPAGSLAFPVETVPAGDQAIARVRELVTEYSAIEVVVGLPRSLSGTEGPAAERIRDHAQALARELSEVPVRLVDERLTTVSAARMLRSQGRKAKQQRAVIDQAAAVAILTDALDAERATDSPPGIAVEAGIECEVRTDPDEEAGR